MEKRLKKLKVKLDSNAQFNQRQLPWFLAPKFVDEKGRSLLEIVKEKIK
jgi:hypothetical protein